MIWGDDMLKKKNRKILNQMEFVSIEDFVPKDHLLRVIEESISFDFIWLYNIWCW